jgi:hypothetical protein
MTHQPITFSFTETLLFLLSILKRNMTFVHEELRTKEAAVPDIRLI